MSFLFGDDPEFSWEQSPEQSWLWQNVIQPLFGNMMGGGIPVPNAPMPSQGWYSGLDESIKQGIREPYVDASKQMLEVMGSKGQTGSAMSPYSGSAQTAFGQFWADASKGMGQQAWNMVNPNQMAQWQAQTQAGFMPYQMLPGITQQALPYPVVTPGSQGFLSGMMNMLGPMGAGWAYGGFQNPFGSSGGAGNAWGGNYAFPMLG